MDQRPAEAGFAPAPCRQHQPRKRPADRARDPGDEGNAGDRNSRVLAIDPGQRCEPCLVEPYAHAEPDHGPAGEQNQGRRSQREQPEPRCEDKVRRLEGREVIGPTGSIRVSASQALRSAPLSLAVSISV